MCKQTFPELLLIIFHLDKMKLYHSYSFLALQWFLSKKELLVNDRERRSLKTEDRKKMSILSLCALRSELLHLFLIFWEVSSSYDKYCTVYSASHSRNKHETQDSFRSITSFPRFLLFVDEWFYVIILLFYSIDVLSYVIVLLFSFFYWTKQDTSSDLHVAHVSLYTLYFDLDGNCSNRLDNDRNKK